MIYKIFTDGGARGNPGPAAAAFVAYAGSDVVAENSRYLNITTNNIAEYEAVLLALKWLESNYKSEDQVNFYLDSLLVVNQLNGNFKIKNSDLKIKASAILSITKQLTSVKFTFSYIPRELNKRADYLVNQNLDLHAV